MSYAIKVENLGKRYLIGHQKKEPYSTLRDTLANGVHNLWNRLRNPSLSGSNDEIEEFWALKDINFEIQPGDRVGIIGRNGAGKSTLLKILSRITEPTTGKFTTRGRVASLLEVGTGFHPELTGRDNIFLNGAILGMSRADVKRQFDAIVDFSGVEKFLDTPVKRYSSGMYVRLAFAVAAHLEPDILIVDEVLAVGDAEFQKRCLGKMEEVGKEGRTVVFVSHNMGAVQSFCNCTMILDFGKIIHKGNEVKEGTQFFSSLLSCSFLSKEDISTVSNEFFSLTDFSWNTPSQAKQCCIFRNDNIPSVKIQVDMHQLASSFNIGVAVYDHTGTEIFWSNNTDDLNSNTHQLSIGLNTLYCQLPCNFLNEGEYQIRLMSSLHFQKWLVNPESSAPTIPLIIQGGLSRSPFWLQKRPGICAPILKWDRR